MSTNNPRATKAPKSRGFCSQRKVTKRNFTFSRGWSPDTKKSRSPSGLGTPIEIQGHHARLIVSPDPQNAARLLEAVRESPVPVVISSPLAIPLPADDDGDEEEPPVLVAADADRITEEYGRNWMEVPASEEEPVPEEEAEQADVIPDTQPGGNLEEDVDEDAAAEDDEDVDDGPPVLVASTPAPHLRSPLDKPMFTPETGKPSPITTVEIPLSESGSKQEQQTSRPDRASAKVSKSLTVSFSLAPPTQIPEDVEPETANSSEETPTASQGTSAVRGSSTGEKTKPPQQEDEEAQQDAATSPQPVASKQLQSKSHRTSKLSEIVEQLVTSHEKTKDSQLDKRKRKSGLAKTNRTKDARSNRNSTNQKQITLEQTLENSNVKSRKSDGQRLSKSCEKAQISDGQSQNKVKNRKRSSVTKTSQKKPPGLSKQSNTSKRSSGQGVKRRSSKGQKVASLNADEAEDAEEVDASSKAKTVAEKKQSTDLNKTPVTTRKSRKGSVRKNISQQSSSLQPHDREESDDELGNKTPKNIQKAKNKKSPGQGHQLITEFMEQQSPQQSISATLVNPTSGKSLVRKERKRPRSPEPQRSSQETPGGKFKDIRMWQNGIKRRRLTDVTDLDMVLNIIEDKAAAFKKEIDALACRKAVDRLLFRMQQDLQKMIDRVQQARDQKLAVSKADRELRVHRQELLESEKDLAELIDEVSSLQQERDRLASKCDSSNPIGRWLESLSSQQKDTVLG